MLMERLKSKIECLPNVRKRKTLTTHFSMKKLLLAVGLSGCAFIQSTSAVLVTITEETQDTFAFDVVWGPNSPDQCCGMGTGAFVDIWSGPADPFLFELKAIDYGHAISVGLRGWDGVGGAPYWVGSADFWFVQNWPNVEMYQGDRRFVWPNVYTGTTPAGYELVAPSSVTEIADGFGAHIVFTRPSDGGGDSSGDQTVPDGGRPLVLLGASLAVMGLVRFHGGGIKES